VETDLGEGFIKALGNPEGPHALACELVGSMLAEWLGLSTLDFSLIELTAYDEIPFLRGGKAWPGQAFISRFEKTGAPWGGTSKELRPLTNRHEISGLVVLDTWILNCDRYAPDRRRVNLDNVLLIQSPGGTAGVELRAIDFTHAFTCGAEINRRISFIEKCRDARIYGLFPEFISLLDREQVRIYAGRIGGFTRAIAEDIIGTVPDEWEVDRQGRAAWATMIADRANFVANHIEGILWPQMELGGGTE
jgi:hypothetical protein